MRILVTGGAGFIGRHLVESLAEAGHSVVIYDSYDEQVHVRGAGQSMTDLPGRVIEGDIRDYESLKACILDEDVEVIFHEAAAVGVGQSMYEIARYVEVNSLGTANLLDILANNKHEVRKIIVASSMSIYGEGTFECLQHGRIYPKVRTQQQLTRREWEFRCSECGEFLVSLPTDENKHLNPTSIYATTKRDQEEMFLQFGEAYKIPSVALRYFNVYGQGQSISNPYTGVAAIFAGRLLNNRPPFIFEDGGQSRDFVHVSDIVKANLMAMEKDEADYQVFNVGTGRPVTVLEVANVLSQSLGKNIEPELLGKYRAGDIRHCFSDISRIRSHLGFEPEMSFEEGMKDLVEWLSAQKADDHLQDALTELEKRHLTG